MSNVRSHLQRLWVSFIAFPLALTALSAALACGMSVRWCPPSEWLAGSLLGLGFVLLVFPFVVLLTVAAIPVLLRWRLFALWHFVVAGAVAGAVGAVPEYWSSFFNDTLRWDLQLEAAAQIFALAVVCAVLFGAFWLAAVWRNRAFA
jgi:hypothetical protein